MIPEHWPAPLARRVHATESGCWEYTGARTSAGYGNIRLGGRSGRNRPTHRLAWELTNGKIPSGLVICHQCDNPPCCNPDHLFIGTHADNVADKIAKGRHLLSRPKFAKLDPDAVRDIRRRRARGVKLTELADEYSVTIATISRAAHGVSWADVA